jgi:hypothetical protein
MAFAEKTSVPVERSKSEIERMLVKFGASAFASSWDANKACIQFAYEKAHVRFELPMPDPTSTKFTHVTPYRERAEAARKALYDQDVRRLWRALALIVKAKIESVQSGVETFETAFLAHMVATKNGQTVGEVIIPHLREGRSLPALPARTG